MFAKFKGALVNVVGNIEGAVNGPVDQRGVFSGQSQQQQDRGPPLKFRYTRPHFLQLNTDDEILVSADHGIRPIIVPRDISKLPWNAGYAECINAGKSIRNEDQAAMHRGLLRTVVSRDGVAAKVADMMPTVPGYPRQIPIHFTTNSKNLQNGANSTIDTPHLPQLGGENRTAPGSSVPVLSNGLQHSPANGNENGAMTVVGRGAITIDGDEVRANQNLQLAGIENSSASRHQGDETPLSPGDLLSPSTPIPFGNLAIGNLEDVNLANSNPTSPQKNSGSRNSVSLVEESLPWIYFGTFDGHAGSGVAVAAANTLHKVINEKLQNIADLLIEFGLKPKNNDDETSDEQEEPECHDLFDGTSTNKLTSVNGSLVVNHDKHLAKENIALLFHPATDKIVTVDSLIIGALEAAFWEMDKEIAKDKRHYKMSGGCTVIVSLFILGKLYVSNAGDSRCIMYKNSKVIPASFDFTPESERERVKYLGMLKPELLGSEFTHLEFVRRPARRDLGKKLLYRDAYMTGWAYKTVTVDDLRFPLVYGEGKRSRVLATIGVTRGFGDHELKAQNSYVDIKPFLTPQPEVRVFDLENEENLTDSDVIIMGTDGLWDVTSNERVCEVVQKAFDAFPANDQQRFKYRYISAAQDLVMTSRGKSKEKGKGWKTSDNKIATIDDISVFVIPLKPYQQEYKKWKEARNLVKSTANSVVDK